EVAVEAELLREALEVLRHAERHAHLARLLHGVLEDERLERAVLRSLLVLAAQSLVREVALERLEVEDGPAVGARQHADVAARGGVVRPALVVDEDRLRAAVAQERQEAVAAVVEAVARAADLRDPHELDAALLARLQL